MVYAPHILNTYHMHSGWRLWVFFLLLCIMIVSIVLFLLERHIHKHMPNVIFCSISNVCMHWLCLSVVVLMIYFNGDELLLVAVLIFCCSDISISLQCMQTPFTMHIAMHPNVYSYILPPVLCLRWPCRWSTRYQPIHIIRLQNE